MKVLIPIENERVAPRFSAASYFAVFDILDNAEVKEKKIIDVSSKGAFEKAKFAKDEKIETVISLGIEDWIYHYLTGFNIKVIPGISGNVDDIVKRLITKHLQFYPFPLYGFKVIPGGRYRRRMKCHRGFHNGHFKNRFM